MRATPVLPALGRSTEFEEILAGVTQSYPMPQMLQPIAEVPWSGIITTAPDNRLGELLASTFPEGRRLKHCFPDDQVSRALSLRTDIVPILHLGRLADSNHAAGVPAVGREWRRIQRRYVGQLVESLPEQIGPGHILCIAGLCINDLIQVEDLIDVLRDWDPDDIYWLVTSADTLDGANLRIRLPGSHIIEQDLPSWLAACLAQPQRAQKAEESRKQTLDLTELAIEVKNSEGAKLLHFRSEELREFRPFLQILGNPTSVVYEPKQRNEIFIRFLAKPHTLLNPEDSTEDLIFVRQSYKDLLDRVRDRITFIMNMLHGERPERGHRIKSGPILLVGPPASGRTVGLLWLGQRLRREKICTVYITPSEGALNSAAIERILRLIEARGAEVIVVLLDRLDRQTVWDLDRRLRSAGRHAVLVATAAPRSESRRQSDDVPYIGDPTGTEVKIEYRLRETEQDSFVDYLRQNAVSTPERALEWGNVEYLFALLYRLVPEARQNIVGVLLQEYDELVQRMAAFRPQVQERVGHVLSEQLKLWIAMRWKHALPSAASPESGSISQEPTDESVSLWSNLARELPLIVMLFTRFDYPIPIELLNRQFPDLHTYYRPLLDVLETHGLIYEVPLDRAGEYGLYAVNQVVAKLILDNVIRDQAEQIRLLGKVLEAYPWDASVYDSLIQRELADLLRSLSPPRGAHQRDFARDLDLAAQSEVYQRLREHLHCELPSLMVTEGIVLRERAGRVDRIDPEQKLRLLTQSETVLRRARQIVSKRPRSPGRDGELANILTALATTVGWKARTLADNTHDAMATDVRNMATDSLRLATAARAYKEVFHPLDVAFWSSRDLYLRLMDRDGEAVQHQRLLLLGQMQSALVMASEMGTLPEDQATRYRERCVQMAELAQGFEVAQKLAEADAAAGRFGGICFLATKAAIDWKHNSIHSQQAAQQGFDLLWRYQPKVLHDEQALILLHRLWVGQHLHNKNLDKGPHLILTNTHAWQVLEQVTRAREQSSDQEPLPYVRFWMAVAQAHQGDVPGALRLLEATTDRTLDLGSRRLDPLVLLAGERDAQNFKGIVKRRDQSEVIVYLPKFGYDVRIRRRYLGLLYLPNRQKGDEVNILVGFSFWGLVGLAQDWRDTWQSAESA